MFLGYSRKNTSAYRHKRLVYKEISEIRWMLARKGRRNALESKGVLRAMRYSQLSTSAKRAGNPRALSRDFSRPLILPMFLKERP
jgi:hypothetical protein